MTEADSQKEPLQPPSVEQGATVEPAKTRSEKPASGGSGKALAAVALLLGVAGLAAGGYSLWQTQQVVAQQRGQAEALVASSEESRRLTQRDQTLAEQIARFGKLPSADELEERRRTLAALQSDQQRLSGRVEQVLGASREEWRLAEAEHLLRMAMLQLSAMQDVKSAEMLVRESDLILRNQDDPAAFGVRQKLLEGLEALRSLPDLDRTGLFLQLGALRGQTSQLTSMAPEFKSTQASPETSGDSRWARWLNELSSYVRVDFSAGNEVQPLLAGQSLAQVRLALSLAIEQAQWAVLNGNAQVYRQSLGQAAAMLEDYFAEHNSQSQGLRDRLVALSQRQVEITLPDLAPALAALQAYVQKQESAGDSMAEPIEPDKPDDSTESAAEPEQPSESEPKASAEGPQA